MTDMIDKLYEMHIKTEQFPLGLPDKEKEREECEKYMFLLENLDGERKAAFCKYVELRGLRQCEELQKVYEYGFKAAMRLWMEGLKE